MWTNRTDHVDELLVSKQEAQGRERKNEIKIDSSDNFIKRALDIFAFSTNLYFTPRFASLLQGTVRAW